MQPKTAAIIQARYSSSRLPGKVLQEIAGEPMLVRVVERTRRASTLHEVLIATSVDPADDIITELCARRGYPCARGSLHDVLDRFYGAARAAGAEVIVRLTADCPVIDPGVIDQTVCAFFGNTIDGPVNSNQYTVNSKQPFAGRVSGVYNPQSIVISEQELNTEHCTLNTVSWDFAANRLPPPWHRTWPIGLDVEVCSFQALERAWREGHQPHHREHVMPYLYEQEGRFRVLVVDHDPDYGALRWTVDTPEDLEVVRRIYAHFGGRSDFSWKEILALYEAEPDLADLNAQVKPKNYSEFDKRREA